MEKKAVAIEANYFSHTRLANTPDSIPGNQDNCFALNFSYMLKERALVFAGTDVKKEQNQFHDSIAMVNDPYFYTYNAGFDSSIVFGKRHTINAGIEFFSQGHKATTTSLAISLGWHHFNMNESGLLQRTPYQRFYKVNQLSLSLQQNLLFSVSSNFKLAWVTRLTILNNFKANTDYSFEEKINASLLDKRIYGLFSHIGFYADYRPLKKVPFYITGQFFDDWSVSDDKDNENTGPHSIKTFHVKGTGGSAGIRYIFKAKKSNK
jgi:hypothetical protein